MLCDLAEFVLKSNVFKFGEKILNEKRGTAIGTKLHLLVAFCLWRS